MKFHFGKIVCFLLLTALPLGGLAAPLTTINRVEDEFALNDQAFRFVGANLRGIAHYGGGDVLPFTTATHRVENLDAVAAMGGRVIRAFAANRFVSPEVAINRLGTLLDEAEARGLRVIVALTDYYTTGLCPPGDEVFYETNPGGFTVLNDAWFSGGFRTNYIPWLRAVVSAFSDRGAVFAWELGNELTNAGNFDALQSFTAEAAAEIRVLDPGTLITAGSLGVNHFGVGLDRALACHDDPNLDFVTIHTYNGEADDGTYRVAWALEKPILVEETGNDPARFSDRPAALTSQLADWMDQRDARGVMQWGFQSQTQDIGDGDRIFGMDPNFFAFDWTAMNAAYGARADLIANNPLPVTPTVLPSGENLAREAIDWRADSVFNSEFGGDRAHDGVISLASKWTSEGTPDPHWLALDLGRECLVTGAIVRSAGAAHELPLFNLITLELQAGPSLDGPWSTVGIFNDDKQRNRAVITLDTAVRTRFVRLFISNTGIDSYARVPEFEVHGTVAPLATGQLLH